MKQLYYTVHAYRFGDRERHSYLVGLYSTVESALNDADAEVEWRAGKYECEVIKWMPDGKNTDGSPGMPREIIKGL